MKKYESLRKQYPEYISLDHLHRICRIAKRSARYLVENGIIPATDTGRKTWRWEIAIDDVIEYLRRRDKVGSMIPTGAVNSKKNKNYATGNRSSFGQIVQPGQERTVAQYFAHICAEYCDVLSTDDIADIIGLQKNSILRLLKAGHIKSLVSSPRYIIPKPYLLEFVKTKRFLEIRTSSVQFVKLLKGFEAWRQN
jgi:hypothetical protein